MRTRIALVAAVPVTLMIASSAPLAHAAAATTRGGQSTTRLSPRLLALDATSLGGAIRAGDILAYAGGLPVGPDQFRQRAASTSRRTVTNTSPGGITLAAMTMPFATTATASAPTATATPAQSGAVPVPAPPPPPVTDATSTDTADWACIRLHESGDRYNSPDAPSGAYGIIEVTWNSFGFSGWPYEASSGVQDALALKLYNEYGWSPWSTRTVCGL